MSKSSSSKKTTSLETISDELDLLDLADNLYYDISNDNHKGAIAILRKEPLLANHVYTNDNYSDLRQTGLEKATPLSIACFYGNYEVVKELFKKQYYIDVNFKSSGNLTPLNMVSYSYQPYLTPLNMGDDASGKGYSIIKKLIQNGADINNMDNEGYTLFTTVCEYYSEDMINYLLKIPNLDMNKQLDGGDGAIHKIILTYFLSEYKENVLSIIEKILKKDGLDINLKGEGGETVLHIVANMDRKWEPGYSDDKLKKLIILLIENGVDPNIKNNRGKLALENDIVQETYNEYVLSKLLKSKQRLAFAKMMIDPKHADKPNDVIVKILKSLKVPPLTEETIDKTNKLLIKTLQEELSKEIEQTLRNKFKGQKLDDMIEFYQKQLENPDLKSSQRRAYKKQKRTRKKKLGIKSGSSDLDTSELELKRAIEMSIQEAKSGSKKKKLKKTKKSKK
jgi:ankyrin repeat protein